MPVEQASAPAAPAEQAAVATAGGTPEVLRTGARFGRWTVETVHPVERGALRVEVRDREGQSFSLEVMSRDASSPARPPAEVGALAVHVCNGGNGWLPTAEEQGLAAMGLAKLLEVHGQAGAIAGLLTHGERVAAHSDVLSAAFSVAV